MFYSLDIKLGLMKWYFISKDRSRVCFDALRALTIEENQSSYLSLVKKKLNEYLNLNIINILISLDTWQYIRSSCTVWFNELSGFILECRYRYVLPTKIEWLINWQLSKIKERGGSSRFTCYIIYETSYRKIAKYNSKEEGRRIKKDVKVMEVSKLSKNIRRDDDGRLLLKL